VFEDYLHWPYLAKKLPHKRRYSREDKMDEKRRKK
jgi:hypothetical protein